MAPHYAGEREVNPKAPVPLSSRLPSSRESDWAGQDSEDGPGLRDPQSRTVKSPPVPGPPGKCPSAGWRTAYVRVEEGPGGLSSAAGGEAPKAGLTSATPRAIGGREEVAPVPGSAPFAPSLRPSRRASPRPVLGAPRPPSRAAPRGAESSRAAARAASPV